MEFEDKSNQIYQSEKDNFIKHKEFNEPTKEDIYSTLSNISIFNSLFSSYVFVIEIYLVAFSVEHPNNKKTSIIETKHKSLFVIMNIFVFPAKDKLLEYLYPQYSTPVFHISTIAFGNPPTSLLYIE